MKSLLSALRPVSRRVRALRAVSALQYGVCAGALLCALCRALSFFLPFRASFPMLAAFVLLPACFGALAGALWPVPAILVARRADECGLRERAVTALCVKGEGAMETLLREDAARRLSSFDARRAMPVRARKRALCIAAAAVFLCLSLAFLPNPQAAVIAAREAFVREMVKQADMVEKAAETAEAGGENRAEANAALRKLAAELREARNGREALMALSETEEALSRLETIDQNARARAASALLDAGFEAMSQALMQGDARALADEIGAETQMGNADALLKALDAAAQAANAADGGALAKALTELSQAAQNDAAGALSNAANAASGLRAGQLSALLSAVRSSAQSASGQATAAGSGKGGKNGAGTGSGKGAGAGMGQGEGGGSGAGEGSSLSNAGYAGEGQGASGVNPKSENKYKTGAFESFYDPTRLGDGGTVSNVTGTLGEGESEQAALGPGAGVIDGYVPYGDVIAEYAQAAARASEYQALPNTQRQWVDEYFSRLTQK